MKESLIGFEATWGWVIDDSFHPLSLSSAYKKHVQDQIKMGRNLKMGKSFK